MSGLSAPLSSVDVRCADVEDVERLHRLPEGLLAVVGQWADVIGRSLGDALGESFTVDVDAMWGRLLAGPLSGVGPPSQPYAVGGGHVHVDVTDADRGLLAALVDSPAAGSPEGLAELAQSCRLPVTPYGIDRSPERVRGIGLAAGPYRDPREIRILDLGTMWAAPLATALAAGLGARVTRVEPSCRRDGLRSSPRLFASLHPVDSPVALDLRRSGDREVFEGLVAESDVLVESFSARVLDNLGFGPESLGEIAPHLRTVSVRAFAASGSRAHWIGYGSGVHAASRLGTIAGLPAPAGFSYLDPVTGIVALDAVLSGSVPHRTVSLEEVADELFAAGVRPPRAEESVRTLWPPPTMSLPIDAPIWRRA